MSSQPTRFFFLHLQKTAGTSLWRRLQQHFPRDQLYPTLNSKGDVSAVIDTDYLLRCWRAHKDELRIVTGHFPLCTTELLGVPFTTLTILRDPVSRTLSYLRHHRSLIREDADRSLAEIYDDPFRFHSFVHNHMVKMLSLTTDTMTDGALTRIEFTHAHLDRAKANLETIDVVGLQDDFDAFCAELARRFGWNLGRPIHMNRTEASPDECDDLRERILADNELDAALWAYARDLVASRTS
jgi:hypothetical protein